MEMTRFAILLYLEAWFSAAAPVSAPHMDLQFIESVRKYHHVGVSQAVLGKAGSHMWYLSEVLLPLSSFDTDVTVEEKCAMIHAIYNVQRSNPQAKCRSIPTAGCTLASLVTKNSLYISQALKLDEAFLSQDPSRWQKEQTYITALQVVKNIRVTNDNSERAIVLLQGFSGAIARKEDHLQFLLSVVEEHIRRFSNSRKMTSLRTFE